MPTFRTATKRLLRPVIATSSIAALAVTSFSLQSPVAAQQGHCATGAEERVLEWSENSNPGNGAVWASGINQFELGEGLTVTASLVDSGPMDEASTLLNSGLLAQASPGTAGALVWNLDTTSLADAASSTLLFEFSSPVDSFSVVTIDVDAKSAEGSSIGWHDKITGVANGENVSIGMIATDPSVVTVDGSSAWAADGKAKTPNESPAGNVTVSATGTLFSAGVTYSDGPRSAASPERHAIGISSVTVCVPSESGATTTTPVSTTVVSPEADADDALAGESTSTTEQDTTTTEQETTTTSVPESTTTTQVPESTTVPSEPVDPTTSASQTTPPPSTEGSQGSVDVTTTASEPVSNGGDSYSFGYTITAVNNESIPLESVQLFHDLQSSLGDAESWKIDNVSAVDGPCIASETYDGATNAELLVDTVDLAPTERCSVKVAVTVTPATDTQRFQASASASAVDSSNQKAATTKSAAAVVTTSPGTKTLAFTGTETEDIAVSGALLLILGATLTSYRDRFLLAPVKQTNIR